MPKSSVSKNVKSGTSGVKGPKGTASQRASTTKGSAPKVTKGRKSAAGSAVAK